MGATINRTARFDAVPNHLALTVSASWRHRVNRTFEAIERQGFAGHSGHPLTTAATPFLVSWFLGLLK